MRNAFGASTVVSALSMSPRFVLVFAALAGCAGEAPPVGAPVAHGREPTDPGAPPSGRMATASRDDQPAALYLRFVRAVGSASSIGDIAAYVTLPVRSHLLRLSTASRSERLVRAKRELPADVKVAGQEIEGDLATLKLAGVREGKAVKGWAKLIRENSGWKVSDEAWER
jgi:hypothetical protein